MKNKNEAHAIVSEITRFDLATGLNGTNPMLVIVFNETPFATTVENARNIAESIRLLCDKMQPKIILTAIDGK